MPETCICNISQFAGTIFSAIVGGVIGFCSAVYVSNRNARSVAAAKLRTAFAPAQVKLSLPRSIGNTEARQYFDEAFFVHAAAIEEFRPFASDSVAYQKAWDDYRKTLHDNDALGDANLRWDSGMMVNEDGDKPLDFIAVIEQKIKTILSYA